MRYIHTKEDLEEFIKQQEELIKAAPAMRPVITPVIEAAKSELVRLAAKGKEYQWQPSNQA
jgi:hypothetical protein